MNKLNRRSRIQVRWSTSPDDMGYGNSPAPKTLPGRPSYVGSPRTAMEYIARVKQNIGQGTYIRIEYRHGAEIIDRGELADIVTDMEYARLYCHGY
jgi:hypothetical protein